MTEIDRANKIYQAAQKIQKQAQDLSPSTTSDVGSVAQHSFQDLLSPSYAAKQKVKEAVGAVDRSEALAAGTLFDDGTSGVTTAIAAQEALYQVELVSTAVSKLAHAWDEVSKIAL